MSNRSSSVRVCKYGVLAFESRDSLLMNLFERLNLTQTYEHAAVYHNDCKYGGINNTQIPNYIYRWTEREIEKTINTYSPCYDHEFQYKYGAAFPCTAALEKQVRKVCKHSKYCEFLDLSIIDIEKSMFKECKPEIE